MKIVIDKKFESMADFIGLLPAMMRAGKGETVYDGRNQVARFRHEGCVFMVKRFKRVNAIQKMVYSFFRKS